MSATSAPAPAAPTPKGPTSSSEPVAPREGIVVEHGTVRRESLRARRWTAEGTVKVSREVDVEFGQVTGTLSVGGPLTAYQFQVRGALDVEGAVEVAGPLRLRGNAHFATTVHATDLDLDGCARAGGAVTVDRTLTARGVLEAPSVAAGVLDLEGAATVPGEIRAIQVEARFTDASTLGGVHARTVRIRGHVTNLLDKVFFRDPRSHVGRIEADRVELEGVDVRFVRAKEILLGRECHVTETEGTIVQRHPSSSVGPEARSRLPFGLRR